MQYRTHEDGPLTSIWLEVGKICVEMKFDHPGAYTRMHSHSFDHWMECISGSARIFIDDKESIIKAGDRYLVEAHKHHGLWPLESNTIVRCVHEHDDIDPSKVDKDSIPIEWLHRLTDKEEE